METKINIAEILKNKPQGTKLYNLLYNINVELDTIVNTGTKIIVWCTDKFGNTDVCHRFYSEFGTIEGYPDGLQILLPFKNMRDWEKFAWKRGDALSCGVDNLCIFEKWANKEYTEFYAKFVTPNYSGNTFKTEKWSKETNEAVIKQYISNIEEFKGGKLNLTTLEIEKTQPEFKDGDVVVTDTIPSMCYSKCIFILKGDLYTKDNKAHSYAFYNISNNHISFDVVDTIIRDREIRLATSLEKLQLFGMLTKEGKYWDSENKQIVDLKPKVKLKPFDKVVVFDELTKKWEYGIFSHYSKNYEGKEVITCIGGCTYFKVLPFNKETAKLVGTTNNVED